MGVGARGRRGQEEAFRRGVGRQLGRARCCWCCCLALAGGALGGRAAGAGFLAGKLERRAPPPPQQPPAAAWPRGGAAARLDLRRRGPRRARPADAAEQPAPAGEGTRLRAFARRWRVRAAAAATLVTAVLWPQAAWARTVRRVASRDEELKAQLFTLGFIVFLFVAAYFHSKKEDSSEDSRIKSEVERLVRLKKEFDEAEASEELQDDNMMASLRAAQQKMADDEAKDAEGGEEAPKEGEEEGGKSKEDAEGAAESEDKAKDDKASDDKASGDTAGDDKSTNDDSKKK